ncbi:MAG: MBL fold metallo-hydrolase [Halobacteriota archaeon]|nr:MBL fold metallo-hydrolase [Halobacteriota archaeon]
MGSKGVIKIADKIYMIEGFNKSRNPWCTTLVIADESIAVIDPGCRKDVLENGLSLLGLKVKDVELVINTHYHQDHTSSSWYIREKSNCQVIMPEQEGKILEDMDAIKRRFFCIKPPETTYFKATMSVMDRPTGFKECKVDDVYKDGDVISLGEVKLEAIHTPGHTDGHTCFMDRDSGMIYTADIDLTNMGPVCIDLTADVSQFIDSTFKIMRLKPKVVVSGHLPVPVTEKIEDKFKSYLSVLSERERKILGLLFLKESTIVELSKQMPILSKKYIDFFSRMGAAPYLEHLKRCMILKHLEKLEEEGVVTRRQKEGDVYFSLANTLDFVY